MSDWSSDVCSSDLIAAAPLKRTVALDGLRVLRARPRDVAQRLAGLARIAITGTIGDRHDADEALVAVDFRQTAHLHIAHILDRKRVVLVNSVYVRVYTSGRRYLQKKKIKKP